MDLHQNLMGSFLGNVLPFHHILSKSVLKFSSNSAYKKQVNRHKNIASLEEKITNMAVKYLCQNFSPLHQFLER